MTWTLHHGDSLDVLRTLPGGSVDAVVTDPPYGLAFMGKRWDYDVPSVALWEQCLRVLKPGGHLLAFAGTRTQHRMAVRIEDAGFEIRDLIAWVYGSGFPKSMDVSKAMDRAAGAEREVVGTRVKAGIGGSQTFAQDAWTQANRGPIQLDITAPATDDAKRWEGWGTALKPAMEPITVARKPLVGTVAANVQRFGTGAINVDGCRVDSEEVTGWGGRGSGGYSGGLDAGAEIARPVVGRWPANLIHDGSDEVVGMFPSDGEATAARFFYTAKASRSDRDFGMDGVEARSAAERTGRVDGSAGINAAAGATGADRNHHPTVKPTDLMRYLCVLVTPPGGTVLDPFCGSGSTGVAAVPAGFRFVGIEREAEYLEIARRRLAAAVGTVGLFVEGGELVAAGSERGERGGSPAAGGAK